MASKTREIQEADTELVSRMLPDSIQDLADISAAMAWSTPDETMTQVFGKNVWVSACFGAACAVNGDPVDHLPKPPKGYEFTRQGGMVQSHEEEVDVETAIRSVARVSKLPEDFVAKVAEAAGYGALAYVSTSGETEVWAKPAGSAHLSGHEASGLETPGLDKAVQAILRFLERKGQRVVSVEDAFDAVIHQTGILDTSRLWWGDRQLMWKFGEALTEAAEAQGITVTQ